MIDFTVVCCRLNEAPVRGFERDVGSKTTMRITYPEGAIQKTERYEAQSLFVLSAFKALDFKWLRHMVFNQRLVRQLKAVCLARRRQHSANLFLFYLLKKCYIHYFLEVFT